MLLLCLALAASCSRGPSKEELLLPATPILDDTTRYAVVTFQILRLRAGPRINTAVLGHLALGDIVEILSREERIIEIEGVTGVWYHVAHEGVDGWIFGAYITIADNRAEAKRLADSL